MTVVRVSRAPCSSGCSDAANSIPSVCFVEAVPAPPSFDDTMISNFSMRLVHDFTHKKACRTSSVGSEQFVDLPILFLESFNFLGNTLPAESVLAGFAFLH